MLRPIALLLAFAVLVTACGRGEEAATPSSLADAATSRAPTSSAATSRVPSPTTEAPAANVSVDLEGGTGPLAEAVAAVYAAALNPGLETGANLPEGLLSQFASREARPGDATVSGSVSTGRILDTEIAVFVAGDDVVLLAGEQGVEAEATEWQVVGAKLHSLDEPAWYGTAPRTVLVIGSDARPGQKVTGFRADSVHIVSAVPAEGVGSIVGIPRDSWVETSYGGRSKLTNTMASRGPEVVVDTVRRLTGLEIEGYMVTGFKGFEDLIDAFGGFEIDVPYGMADPKSDAYFRAGVQRFDGADALAFARNRSDTPNGDFGRQFNHGRIMLAVLPEVQERGVAALPRLLELLTMFVITDLSAADLLAVTASGFELSPETVTNVVAPGRVGVTSGGASVVFLRDEAFELFDDVADGRVDGEY